MGRRSKRQGKGESRRVIGGEETEEERERRVGEDKGKAEGGKMG